eukprot:Platyproteum_vivax@DN14648_c0_g1_i1.p1
MAKKIKNDQAKAVVVEETSLNPAKLEVAEIKWGRTKTGPGTEGRTVLLAHHVKLNRDKVHKHIQEVIGGDTSITAVSTSNKGISLVLFDSVANARNAITKVDHSTMEGHPCRATMSQKDFTLR